MGSFLCKHKKQLEDKPEVFSHDLLPISENSIQELEKSNKPRIQDHQQEKPIDHYDIKHDDKHKQESEEKKHAFHPPEIQPIHAEVEVHEQIAQPAKHPEHKPEVKEDIEDIVLENMVKRYLNDEHINSKFIPDFIEKKLYKNILKILIGILKDTMENAEINVLDHKIKFTIEPLGSL